MEVIEKKDQLYILDDGRVREFLILGSEYAILIDTGFADSQVFETVKKITDLPVKVLLTHGDRDHAEGLEKFGECWAMEEDWSMIDSRIVLHPMPISWKLSPFRAIPTEARRFWTGRRDC